MALFDGAPGDAARIWVGLYRSGLFVALAILGFLAQRQFDALGDDIKQAGLGVAELKIELAKQSGEIKGRIESVAVEVKGQEGRLDRLEGWRDRYESR